MKRKPRKLSLLSLHPENIVNFLRSERGNIESALTLIPLLLLFLGISQLSVAVYSRIINNQRTQGAVAFAAMGSTQDLGRPGDLGWSSPPFALPLPGGGSILVGQRRIQLPGLTPFFSSGESYLSTGVAVQE